MLKSILHVSIHRNKNGVDVSLFLKSRKGRLLDQNVILKNHSTLATTASLVFVRKYITQQLCKWKVRRVFVEKLLLKVVNKIICSHYYHLEKPLSTLFYFILFFIFICHFIFCDKANFQTNSTLHKNKTHTPARPLNRTQYSWTVHITAELID